MEFWMVSHITKSQCFAIPAKEQEIICFFLIIKNYFCLEYCFFFGQVWVIFSRKYKKHFLWAWTTAFFLVIARKFWVQPTQFVSNKHFFWLKNWYFQKSVKIYFVVVGERGLLMKCFWTFFLVCIWEQSTLD